MNEYPLSEFPQLLAACNLEQLLIVQKLLNQHLANRRERERLIKILSGK